MNTGLQKDSITSISIAPCCAPPYLQHKILLPAGLVTSNGHRRALHILHFQGHICIEFIWGMKQKMLPPSSYSLITSPATTPQCLQFIQCIQGGLRWKAHMGRYHWVWEASSRCFPHTSNFQSQPFLEIQAQMNKNPQVFTCNKTGTKSVKS